MGRKAPSVDNTKHSKWDGGASRKQSNNGPPSRKARMAGAGAQHCKRFAASAVCSVELRASGLFGIS